LNESKQFRLITVRVSLLVTGLLAVAGLLLSRAAAHGVLLGGISSVLVFWIRARRLEFANADSNHLQLAVYIFAAARFLVYGLILYRSYWLDPEHYYGFIGAAVGILVVHVVLVALGLTRFSVDSDGSQ